MLPLLGVLSGIATGTAAACPAQACKLARCLVVKGHSLSKMRKDYKIYNNALTMLALMIKPNSLAHASTRVQGQWGRKWTRLESGGNGRHLRGAKLLTPLLSAPRPVQQRELTIILSVCLHMQVLIGCCDCP